MVSAEILKDVLRSVSSKVFTLFSSHFMWVPVKCNYSASVNQYLSFSDTIKIIMTKLTWTTGLAEFRELSGEVTASVLP